MATAEGESLNQSCCHDMLSVRIHKVHLSWADEYLPAQDCPWGRLTSFQHLPLCHTLGPFMTGNSSTEWSGLARDIAAAVFFSAFPKNTNDCVYESSLSGQQIYHFSYLFTLFLSGSLPTSTQEYEESKSMTYSTLKGLVNLKNSFRTLVHKNTKDVVGGMYVFFLLWFLVN